MISTRRAWLTCCLFPSPVGQSNRSLRGSYNVRRLLVADFVTGQLVEKVIIPSLRPLFARGVAQ